MPLRLRLPHHESVDLYRKAASQRFRDAATLANHGRRLGAVYLFGYCVEMLLKAAFFRLQGTAAGQAIQRYEALTIARFWGLEPPTDWHDLRWWNRLVIAARDAVGRPLPPREASSLTRRVDTVARNWHGGLRDRVI
jgi:HEPN domain-containing protein